MTAVAGQDRAADVVLCCALAGLLWIGAGFIRTAGTSVRHVRRTRRRRRDPLPEDLARVDRQLRINMSSARYFHHGLRPVLRDLATTLSQGSIALDSALGPLYAEMPAPEDVRLRGPNAEELECIIAALEEIAAS